MVRVLRLGTVGYAEALERMRAFNRERTDATKDEIWLLEHPPVFTRGVSCNLTPHRNPSSIPVVDSDRGGQITYHGPGQQIAYLLFDLKRSGRGVKRFVSDIEQAVIDTLGGVGIVGARRPGAPGVYVDGRKIAALGLRVRNGCSYHGVSINISMDLSPFSWIDPCGYPGLGTVNAADLAPGVDREALVDDLANRLARLVNNGEEAPPRSRVAVVDA